MAWKLSVNVYLNTLRFIVFQAIQMSVLTPPIAHNPHNIHGNGYHQLTTKIEAKYNGVLQHKQNMMKKVERLLMLSLIINLIKQLFGRRCCKK